MTKGSKISLRVNGSTFKKFCYNLFWLKNIPTLILAILCGTFFLLIAVLFDKVICHASSVDLGKGALGFLLAFGFIAFKVPGYIHRKASAIYYWHRKFRESDEFKRNLYISILGFLTTFIITYRPTASGQALSVTELTSSAGYSFVVFLGLYAILFFINIGTIIKKLADTSIRDIWDDKRISGGLVNAHIASVIHRRSIPKFFLSDLLRPRDSCSGHIYLTSANYHDYASWIEEIINCEAIGSYETMNTSHPDYVLGHTDTGIRETYEKILNMINKSIRKRATRLQVVDICGYASNVATSLDPNDINIDPLLLSKWLNDKKIRTGEWRRFSKNIKRFWQYRHFLLSDCYPVCDYVVVNRLPPSGLMQTTDDQLAMAKKQTMVIKYNENENLLQLLFGDVTSVFCRVFNKLDEMHGDINENLDDINEYKTQILKHGKKSFLNIPINASISLESWQDKLLTAFKKHSPDAFS